MKLSHILKTCIFGVWGAEGRWRLQYENDFKSRREHRATFA